MDYKEQLIRLCRTDLIEKGVEPEKVLVIINVFITTLADFTVEPITTAITVNSDRNAQLI